MSESKSLMQKIMPHNEHKIDRAIRVILGIGLLSIVFVGPKTMWGLVGLVPLLTGLIGTCPMYTLFGIGTCPISGKKQPSEK